MTFYLYILLIALILYTVFIYNKLIRLRNLAEEAWSGIDVQLQKRHDLIPAIVNVVKGYAGHERELFNSITELRTAAMRAENVKEQEAAEVGLSKSLGNLFVVVENYPELKASENFMDLQLQLSIVENDLQRARRYYNGTVRNYNILIEQFPSQLVARAADHKQKDYFDIKNETERMVPAINFEA